MAKKKTQGGGPPGDRHKPRRMVGIRLRLAEQLALLCQQRATDLTEEVNRAVRELLEREGLWPPPAKEG